MIAPLVSLTRPVRVAVGPVSSGPAARLVDRNIKKVSICRVCCRKSRFVPRTEFGDELSDGDRIREIRGQTPPATGSSSIFGHSRSEGGLTPYFLNSVSVTQFRLGFALRYA